MANTPAYNVPLPDVGGSRNLWGTLNNTLHNTWDSLLGGSAPVTGIDINSGTIDGVTIGAATPSTGAFTTLSSSGNTTLGDAAGDTLTLNAAAWSAPNGFAIDTNKLVLDSAGNAGLGVVPSAWGAGYISSQIGSTTHLTHNGNSGALILGSNFYNDGTNDIYLSSNPATRFSIARSSGNSVWSVSTGTPSSGQPVTFTNAMTLTNAGNLGLGNTTPDSFNQAVGAPHLVVGSGANNAGVTIYSGSALNGSIAFADGIVGNQQIEGRIRYNHTDNSMSFFTTATERARVTGSGDFIKTVNTSAPALTVNNTMVTSLPNNTTLRFHVRGSDGVTRTADLTLA